MHGHERPGVELAFEDHGGEIGTMPHLRVSLEAYFHLIDELVLRAARSKFRPTQIVAITFGGVVPGRAIAQALRLPLAYLGAESYRPASDDDARHMEPGEDIVFARDLITTRPGFGTKVLLVDDLTDHGRTFRDSIAYLQKHPTYGSGIGEIHTACLWRKAHSAFTPNFAVDHVVPVMLPGTKTKRIPWIDQPLERLYAVSSIEEIEARIRARQSTNP
ncbi:MAG: phosphoribosyltransferase family protein [bacterium]|nr:phosphoribosyltransferase family protein [bacterium]